LDVWKDVREEATEDDIIFGRENIREDETLRVRMRGKGRGSIKDLQMVAY
jgi:hypothetical protein